MTLTGHTEYDLAIAVFTAGVAYSLLVAVLKSLARD